MIFFPTMYEDELLYSAIARYHKRSGNIYYMHTTEDVYGRKHVKSSIYLPSNINNLIENLPINHRFKEEDIIFNHTLYPFYTAFLSEDMSNKILNSMKEENGGDIYARAGICASTISIPRYLKFCPECFKKDIEVHGEAYWHRIHQVQCVKVCPKHKTILQESNVNINSYNKQQYIAASVHNCIIKRQYKYSKDTIEKLYNLAKDVEYLLQCNHERKYINWYTNNYINYLMNKGLATPNGRIRQDKLVLDFKEFYGDIFLDTIESNIEYNNSRNWLSEICRMRRYSIHPVRQLLFIRYLGVKIENLFNLEYEFKPFGDGPWTCFNKASDHYNEKVIKNLVIKNSYATNKITGKFSCECGYTYLKEYNNENVDNNKKTRVLKFGNVWEEKLINLVSEDILSIHEIACQLDLDWNGVYKYIIKLGLNPPLKTNNKKLRNFIENKNIENKSNKYNKPQNIEEKRKIILNIICSYPEKSRTEIKGLNPKVYVYLQNNDRDWLEANLPSKRKGKAKYSNINWNKRDSEIELMIKDFIENINKTEGKPKWINLTMIGKSLNIYDLLQKHLDKLPNTSKYLNSIIESGDEYRVRKIKWAINEIIINGDNKLNMTKVALKAGVEVKDTIWKSRIKEEIKKYDSNFLKLL